MGQLQPGCIQWDTQHPTGVQQVQAVLGRPERKPQLESKGAALSSSFPCYICVCVHVCVSAKKRGRVQKPTLKNPQTLVKSDTAVRFRRKRLTATSVLITSALKVHRNQFSEDLQSGFIINLLRNRAKVFTLYL